MASGPLVMATLVTCLILLTMVHAQDSAKTSEPLATTSLIDSTTSQSAAGFTTLPSHASAPQATPIPIYLTTALADITINIHTTALSSDSGENDSLLGVPSEMQPFRDAPADASAEGEGRGGQEGQTQSQTTETGSKEAETEESLTTKGTRESSAQVETGTKQEVTGTEKSDPGVLPDDTSTQLQAAESTAEVMTKKTPIDAETSTVTTTTPNDELSEKSETLNNDNTQGNSVKTAAIIEATDKTEPPVNVTENSKAVDDKTTIKNEPLEKAVTIADNVNTSNSANMGTDKPPSEEVLEGATADITSAAKTQVNAPLVSDDSQITADTDNTITVKTEALQSDETKTSDLEHGGEVEAPVSDGDKSTDETVEALASSQSLPQTSDTQVDTKVIDVTKVADDEPMMADSPSMIMEDKPLRSNEIVKNINEKVARDANETQASGDSGQSSINNVNLNPIPPPVQPPRRNMNNGVKGLSHSIRESMLNVSEDIMGKNDTMGSQGNSTGGKSKTTGPPVTTAVQQGAGTTSKSGSVTSSTHNSTEHRVSTGLRSSDSTRNLTNPLANLTEAQSSLSERGRAMTKARNEASGMGTVWLTVAVVSCVSVWV